jgi:hypothetical protein
MDSSAVIPILATVLYQHTEIALLRLDSCRLHRFKNLPGFAESPRLGQDSEESRVGQGIMVRGAWQLLASPIQEMESSISIVHGFYGFPDVLVRETDLSTAFPVTTIIFLPLLL